MTARLQHHLVYGSVGHAARSLAPTPSVELNEDIYNHHVLHPVEEQPTPTPTMFDALLMDKKILTQVCRVAPRGRATAPPATQPTITWYLHSKALLQRDAIVGHAEAIRTQSRKPSKAHTHKKRQPTNAGQPRSTRRKEATPQLGAAHAASEDTTHLSLIHI